MKTKYYSVEICIEHLFDIYGKCKTDSDYYSMNENFEKISERAKGLNCQYALNKNCTRVCVLFDDPKQTIEFYTICNRVLGKWKAEIKVIQIDINEYISKKVEF